MNRHDVTTTKNGLGVYINLLNSPAAIQVSQQPHLLTLATELLAVSTLKGKTVQIEQNMGRVVGITDVVSTEAGDSIVYAKRIKSDAFTRFVKNRELAPTKYLTIELHLDDEGNYQLWSIHLGHAIPALPEEEVATPKSKTFWSSHAVIWGNLPIQSQSITRDCPWSV